MNLLDKFISLKKNFSSSKDSFYVDSISENLEHRIGVTEKGQPVFFIKTTQPYKNFLDVNLDMIRVSFNQNCELICKPQEKVKGIYSTVILKSESEDMIDYFLNSIALLVQNLGNNPTISKVKIEIDKLINLFKHFKKPPKNTIQGLWSELLFIEQSGDIDYVIKSWHASKNDRYDFNDGKDKVEIKSTSKNERTHRFNQVQLSRTNGFSVFVGSLYSIETNMGKSINDLFMRIKSNTKDQDLIYKINLIISNTLGRDLERMYDVFFDYSLAISTKEFYNSNDIPNIEKENIPTQISNIKFDCNLDGIEKVDETKVNSKLLNALLKK